MFLISDNREDEAQLVDTYQYEDNQEGDEDAFSREPFILRFTCKHTGNRRLRTVISSFYLSLRNVKIIDKNN